MPARSTYCVPQTYIPVDSIPPRITNINIEDYPLKHEKISYLELSSITKKKFAMKQDIANILESYIGEPANNYTKTKIKSHMNNYMQDVFKKVLCENNINPDVNAKGPSLDLKYKSWVEDVKFNYENNSATMYINTANYKYNDIEWTTPNAIEANQYWHDETKYDHILEKAFAFESVNQRAFREKIRSGLVIQSKTRFNLPWKNMPLNE